MRTDEKWYLLLIHSENEIDLWQIPSFLRALLARSSPVYSIKM